MTIEFGEKLPFPNLVIKFFRAIVGYKDLGTVYLIFLNKHFPFNKRFYDPDSQLFSLGMVIAEEEICRFAVGYINNARY